MSATIPELPEIRVYVSSTSNDLKEYRALVIAALRKMEMIAVCMEDYVAQSKLPVKKCLEDVGKCDIYVGFFARRYGFIPDGYNKSITELEYRKAVDSGIPTLTFLLNENVSWPDEYCDAGENKLRIDALRKHLMDSYIVSWFTNSQELVTETMAAVSITRNMR
ncbi:MAG: DUF4062 domain-containing protein [Nitrospirae bacterium]|nr:DUF4062 domain-containing protein [Nitrospirota bacterium]